ncbi:translation initiation factor IF-2 [bacterium]|nr:translation initiation factor IF-2 [bacterium]
MTSTTQTTQRPPIVVILGHIDHGKSSLLEAIKDLKITQKEAGGITQHIGAYQIEHKGEKITFLDTPGHEAFWAIRSRGAKVADIAILVVAADEGVKPQTVEAIKCIKEANIPTIVAINKIDKPEANPVKVKQELAKEGVLVEGFGGDVPVVETSAKTRQGVDELMEMILLVAQMENLKADLQKTPEGVVIEAYLDPKRGPTATLIVKEGILKEGDVIATKSVVGKARILEDFRGKRIKEAYPSQPVVVIGFEEVPIVGEQFRKFASLEEAREQVVKEKKETKRTIVEPGKKILNLIIKADVLGSLEAIETVIERLPQSEVILRVLKSDVGDVNEEDVALAISGEAKILAFRVKNTPQAERLARDKGVKIFHFEIIYDLAQKIRELIREIVESEVVREDIGQLRVLVVFRTEPNRQIVGGRVIKGEFIKGAKVEIFREEKKIGQGKILNLQKEKKDIEKGQEGDEIGILYEGGAKIKEGDILKAFIEKRKTIEI